MGQGEVSATMEDKGGCMMERKRRGGERKTEKCDIETMWWPAE